MAPTPPSPGGAGRASRWMGVAIAALVVGALAGGAEAQFFRIAYDVDRSRPDQIQLKGQLVNEGTTEVLDVHVRGQALDRAGKVVASGIAFVDARIERGQARPFVIAIPTVPGVTRFRVDVSSFRPGFGAQAP